MYAGKASISDGSAARPVCGAGGSAVAGEVGGVQGGVREASRGGGDDLRRGACPWPAAVALCRGGEDTLPAPGDGSGDQRQPHQQLAKGQAPRANEDIGLRQADGTAEPELRHSPAVSKVRKNPFCAPITSGRSGLPRELGPRPSRPDGRRSGSPGFPAALPWFDRRYATSLSAGRRGRFRGNRLILDIRKVKWLPPFLP